MHQLRPHKLKPMSSVTAILKSQASLQILKQAWLASHTGQIECRDAAAPPRPFACASNTCTLIALNTLQAWYQIQTLSSQCRDALPRLCPWTHASQQQNGFRIRQQENYNPSNARIPKNASLWAYKHWTSPQEPFCAAAIHVVFFDIIVATVRQQEAMKIN